MHELDENTILTDGRWLHISAVLRSQGTVVFTMAHSTKFASNVQDFHCDSNASPGADVGRRPCFPFSGLQVFFSPGGNLRQDVVSACLDKLLLIQQWFDKQTQFAFYASSVLIVYDGAIPAARTRTGAHDAQNGSEAPDSEQPATNESKSNTSNDDASNDSVPVEVRMIDFAHVFPTQTVDENYAFGLGSLIKYLRRLVPDSE